MVSHRCEYCGKSWFDDNKGPCTDCEEEVTSPYNIGSIKEIMRSFMQNAGALDPEFFICSGQTHQPAIVKLLTGKIMFSNMLPEIVGSGYVNGFKKKFAVVIRQRVSMGESLDAKNIADYMDADFTFLLTPSDPRAFVDWLVRGGQEVLLRTTKGGSVHMGQINMSTGKIQNLKPTLQHF